MINFIIKLMFAGDNFSQRELLKLVLIALSIVLSVISVLFARKYYRYEGEQRVGFVKTSSKGWIAVSVIFGIYGAIVCLAATIQSIHNLPKVCNKCGTLTKYPYTVCKKCLAKNDFTLVNADSVVINEKFKNPSIAFTIIATLLYIIGGFIN